jgi:tetratricopeptide (TPR) repeat protein
MMRKVLAVALVSLLTTAAVAQAGYATVKGVCTDEEGKPIAGAEVRLVGTENGRKYTLKTNAKGEYFSIGIQSGKYRYSLVKDGKEIWYFGNIEVRLSVEVNELDFDLKKERALAVKEGRAPQLTEAQKKAIAEAEKEEATVKNLNDMLKAARTARESGDAQTAINIMKKAIEADSTRALLWFHLGESQMAAARQQTDKASRVEYFEQASQSYRNAVEISAASTDPAERQLQPSFRNNLAKALEGAGKIEEAAAGFEAAAQAATNPKDKAQFYFNAGAMYSNTFRPDDAIKAFDKCIAADPERADAYYQKGAALVSKATVGKDGSYVAPPGTSETLNKYLELAPDGPFAQQARELLTAIGAKVETTFKSGKKKN